MLHNQWWEIQLLSNCLHLVTNRVATLFYWGRTFQCSLRKMKQFSTIYLYKLFKLDKDFCFHGCETCESDFLCSATSMIQAFSLEAQMFEIN